MENRGLDGLPEPLVPAEVDLRTYEWMPLDINRLLSSETWVLGAPEECKAALTLWCEAWRQLPAASLPDNDRMLAHLSRAGADWPRIRENVMRSWIKCADGRLYHPVVAEKACEAWELKVKQKARTKGATEARRRKREEEQLRARLEALQAEQDACGDADMFAGLDGGDTSTSRSTLRATSRSTLRSPPDQTGPDQNGSESSLCSLSPPPRGGEAQALDKPAPGGRVAKVYRLEEERAFAAFWEAYPAAARTAPDYARAAYRKALRAGAAPERILAALRREKWRDDPRYIAAPANWLKGGSWRLDTPEPVPPRAAGSSPFAGWETVDHVALGEWRSAEASGEWMTRDPRRNALPVAERHEDLLETIQRRSPRAARYIAAQEAVEQAA